MQTQQREVTAAAAVDVLARKKSPRFITRMDSDGGAQFYFSERADADAFSAFHDKEVFESSPPTAGGGLWRVVLPFTAGAALPFGEQINGSIELGRAVLAAHASIGGAA